MLRVNNMTQPFEQGYGQRITERNEAGGLLINVCGGYFYAEVTQ